MLGDRIFGEDRAADARRGGAWKAMHSRSRHYAERLSTGCRFGIAPGRLPSLAGLMTNYLHYSFEPDDTVDEAYARWLDNNSFPAMRQLLTDQGCQDVVVLRSVPNREALGTFHAVATRDGEAHARDGQPFYALNSLDSQGDEAIVEIQFRDAFWMLATATDLETPSP